jgi:hypothetical protein
LLFQYSSEINGEEVTTGRTNEGHLQAFNIPLKSPAGLVFVLGFKAFPPRFSGFVGTYFYS